MPQSIRPTGQTSTTANPALTAPTESSTQAYGRTRVGSGSQPGDDKVSSGAAEVMDHAKETISDVASQAGGKVTEQLDTQRDRAASSLGTVAHALRQTSDQIRDQNDNAGLPLHQYVASAADQVERFSGYLRSTDVRQMMGDVEQFARRQPGLFFGGAFLLGLIGARFLKSSGENATNGRRSMYGSGEFAGRDNYKDLPYDSAQGGYSAREYPPVASPQYDSSGRGSSTPYVPGVMPGSAPQGHRSGESSAGQSSTTVPANTAGIRTGDI